MFCLSILNPLSANITKWSTTVKQFKLPTNCFSVFDHFVGLMLKGLSASRNPQDLTKFNFEFFIWILNWSVEFTSCMNWHGTSKRIPNCLYAIGFCLTFWKSNHVWVSHIWRYSFSFMLSCVLFYNCHIFPSYWHTSVINNCGF